MKGVRPSFTMSSKTKYFLLRSTGVKETKQSPKMDSKFASAADSSSKALYSNPMRLMKPVNPKCAPSSKPRGSGDTGSTKKRKSFTPACGVAPFTMGRTRPSTLPSAVRTELS